MVIKTIIQIKNIYGPCKNIHADWEMYVASIYWKLLGTRYD